MLDVKKEAGVPGSQTKRIINVMLRGPWEFYEVKMQEVSVQVVS
jgi:hypothetical protein